MGPVGEIRLVPDPATFTVIPYAPRSAVMLVDHVRLDRAPYEACPRRFLARMVGRLASGGSSCSAPSRTSSRWPGRRSGRLVPIDSSTCFSTTGMTAAAEFVDAIVGALDAQGIPLAQYYPELGHGQHELSVLPRPALAAADTQVLVRETIRGVAAGVRARGLARPEAVAGSSGQRRAHPFQRLGPGGRPEPVPRPSRAVRAVGARRTVRRRDPRSSTRPARLDGAVVQLVRPPAPPALELGVHLLGSGQPGGDGTRASAFWGEEAASPNLEFKPADASSNPYLAFGGLIAAGLDGIERELVPPPRSPSTLPAFPTTSGRRRESPATRPRSPRQLDALEADDVLLAALGEPLARSYLAVRRSEWDAYSAADEEFAFANHFAKY